MLNQLSKKILMGIMEKTTGLGFVNGTTHLPIEWAGSYKEDIILHISDPLTYTIANHYRRTLHYQDQLVKNILLFNKTLDVLRSPHKWVW